MAGSVTVAKRLGRIATASLPVSTRIGLAKAEFSQGRDHVVPFGSIDLHLLADTNRIDYFTLYGAIIDRHFDSDVAGAVVLDIGAHKGYFAARAVNDGALRVESYEPASQNLVALMRSAESLPTWQVHPVAVGAEDGTVTLNLSAGSWGHSIHEPLGGEVTGTEEVELVALSDRLREASADGVPVVAKINVEGAAGSMIMGTEPPDWLAVRSLWIDLEPNDPVGMSELTEHLASCGLRLVAAENNRRRFERE